MSLPGRAARNVAKSLSMGEVLGLRRLATGSVQGAPGAVHMGRSAAAMGRMGGRARLEGARAGLGGAGRRAAHMGMPNQHIPRPSGRGALNGARAGLHSPGINIPRPPAMRGMAGGASGLDTGPMRRYMGSRPAPPKAKWADAKRRSKKVAKYWAGGMATTTGLAAWGNSRTSSGRAGLPPGSQTGMYGM